MIIRVWRRVKEWGVLGIFNTIIPIGTIINGTEGTLAAISAGDYRAAGKTGIQTLLIAVATAVALGEGATAPAGGKGAGTAAIGQAENAALKNAAKEGALGAGNSSAPTLKPGPYAKDGILARGPGRDFTRAERNAVNAEGVCHTCGSTDPKTKSGDFIPDHQPPNGLIKPGETQRLFPHCRDCARLQGGEVTAAKTRKE